ncbi:hypothetical protein FOQG_18560 [Fusarium oxysporum f. sp. raphani 54005]|uniref:Uncharacterized protein n=1 Tax=Fusarium oxysporum f. sp. raphani 54005 TaxID=1089458 RepID=X0BE21_FUSOX|nr:hypothetical protein FOQG_18560 [Fusarium oxysporum f. sp. raphani 54005]
MAGQPKSRWTSLALLASATSSMLLRRGKMRLQTSMNSFSNLAEKSSFLPCSPWLLACQSFV